MEEQDQELRAQRDAYEQELARRAKEQHAAQALEKARRARYDEENLDTVRSAGEREHELKAELAAPLGSDHFALLRAVERFGEEKRQGGEAAGDGGGEGAMPLFLIDTVGGSM